MTNPERNAFFIAQLARKLTEEQLWEIVKGAQDARGYGDRQNPAPKLSQMQQELCDWLAQDGFRAAADERLVAERDAALKERDEIRASIYDATRGFESVKRSSARLLDVAEQCSTMFTELQNLLKDVPKPKDRY